MTPILIPNPEIMATYRLSVELGWNYHAEDGSLAITQLITIDAQPTDKIKVSTGNIIDGRVAVTLQIDPNGSTNRPVENSISHYQKITAGLADIEQIRNEIKLMVDDIMISTTFVGTDGMRSTSINISSSESQIQSV